MSERITSEQGWRFVRGGGCTTVGVVGLVQSGGFGNFFKKFGTAAGSLLEAEIVTAGGQVRVANACRDPDLFWGHQGWWRRGVWRSHQTRAENL